jgi:hypothetical protein
LKEAAQEVAGAFGSALKGEEKAGKQQTGSRPASMSDTLGSQKAGASTPSAGSQSAGRSSTETTGGPAAGVSSGSTGSTASSRSSGGSPSHQPQTGNVPLGSSTKRS